MIAVSVLFGICNYPIITINSGSERKIPPHILVRTSAGMAVLPEQVQTASLNMAIANFH